MEVVSEKCVFGHRIHRIRLDARPKQTRLTWFHQKIGSVWTGPTCKSLSVEEKHKLHLGLLRGRTLLPKGGTTCLSTSIPPTTWLNHKTRQNLSRFDGNEVRQSEAPAPFHFSWQSGRKRVRCGLEIGEKTLKEH